MVTDKTPEDTADTTATLEAVPEEWTVDGDGHIAELVPEDDDGPETLTQALAVYDWTQSEFKRRESVWIAKGEFAEDYLMANAELPDDLLERNLLAFFGRDKAAAAAMAPASTPIYAALAAEWAKPPFTVDPDADDDEALS